MTEEQTEKLLSHLDTIGRRLAFIGEQLESAAESLYSINERLDDMTGTTEGGKFFLRVADMFRD